MSKVVDLAERREFKAFMKRVDQAARDFSCWVLDADHKPVRVGLIEMADWKARSNDCIVAQTVVGERLVSTVFIGTDMGHGMSRVPILFETMIFGPGQSTGYDRYATWDMAERGHKAAVASLTRSPP